MVEVKLPYDSANDVLEIVRALRAQGLTQGRDFDFACRPPIYDEITYQLIQDKHATFKFYVEKWATWFILKYKTQS